MCIEYMCIIRYMVFYFLLFLEILIIFVYKKIKYMKLLIKVFIMIFELFLYYFEEFFGIGIIIYC